MCFDHFSVIRDYFLKWKDCFKRIDKEVKAYML